MVGENRRGRTIPICCLGGQDDSRVPSSSLTGLAPDRGKCYIQPVLAQGHSVGSASTAQLENAATGIINKCVAKQNPEGGIAHNIGKPFSSTSYLSLFPSSFEVNARASDALLIGQEPNVKQRWTTTLPWSSAPIAHRCNVEGNFNPRCPAEGSWTRCLSQRGESFGARTLTQMRKCNCR